MTDAVQCSDIEVDVMTGENVSVALVESSDGQFVGEAKRFPGDQRDPKIGRDLALGRALAKYGQFLIDRAIDASNCGH